MPNDLTEEGRYQAQAIEWELIQSEKSESVGVRITYVCLAIWDEFKRAWQPYPSPQPKCEGTLWIQKRDGLVNERAVRDLCRVLKWDGDLATIVEEHRWRPPACEVTVKGEQYNGKTRYRAEWINEPGSRGQGKEIAKRVMSAQGANFKRIAEGLPLAGETAGPATDAMTPPTANELPF